MSNPKVSTKAFTPTDPYSALFQAPVAVVSEGQWPLVLQTLQIQSATQTFPQPCPRELVQRHYQIERTSAEKRLPVRFLGYAPVFPETRIYHGQGCDWALMNLTDDPLFYSNGEKLIVPAAVARDISRMVKEGINFDAVFVAHEIPSGVVKPGEQVPLELIAPPPSPEVMRRVSAIEKGTEAFWQRILTALRITAEVGATAAVGALSFAAVLATRDPVLFGAQINDAWTVKGQPIGMWYYVTHWYWPSH